MPSLLQRRLQLLRDFSRVLLISWRAARKWTLAWTLLIVLEGLLPAALVYLTRTIVNGLAGLGGHGLPWQAIVSLAPPIALFLGVLVAMEILHGVSNWIRSGQSERVNDYIQDQIHIQANRLDLEVFEKPDFHDEIYRASSQSASRSVSMLENLGGLVRGGITLTAMVLVLIPYAWWLPIALVGSTLPALFLMVRQTREQHRWWLESTPLERKASYYDWLITSGSASAEIRSLALGDFLRESYRLLRRTLRRKKNQLELRNGIAGIAASLIALLVFGACLLLMLYRMSDQSFRLGDLALVYQAFYQGQSVARGLVGNLGSVYQNGMFMGNLFEYLALEPKIQAPAHPAAVPEKITTGFELRKVDFQYPGSPHLALQNLSISIPANQVTVVVGPNGSGKSTLLKLLCRLHDPRHGQILLDGHDLKTFDPTAWRRHLSVLFQEPLDFQGTVQTNVTLGQMEQKPDPQRLRQALQEAGLSEKIASLANGIQTPLGKWFTDGSELSGGEWRRIALARAAYRNSPIILLDEPNSAMDALAEADWLKQFRRFSQGRTTVIISHRLAIARHADHLIVLDKGKLAEQGTHEELKTKNGIYARLYNSQADCFEN